MNVMDPARSCRTPSHTGTRIGQRCTADQCTPDKPCLSALETGPIAAYTTMHCHAQERGARSLFTYSVARCNLANAIQASAASPVGTFFPQKPRSILGQCLLNFLNKNYELSASLVAMTFSIRIRPMQRTLTGAEDNFHFPCTWEQISYHLEVRILDHYSVDFF